MYFTDSSPVALLHLCFQRRHPTKRETSRSGTPWLPKGSATGHSVTPKHLTDAPEMCFRKCTLVCFSMLFFFAKQERAACLFSFLLSILEVQWDLAILTVLASLGHLARLSLQWDHQDPTDQERFVDFFFSRLSQADIQDIIARPETGYHHPKNAMETPHNCQMPMKMQGFTSTETGCTNAGTPSCHL